MKSSFRRQLILFYLLLFVSFGAGVFVLQQYRETAYRRQALSTTLKSYSDIIQKVGIDSTRILPQNLRVTLIAPNGTVLYDNEVADVATLDNHNNRPEITQAHTSGVGTAIRHSDTKGIDFFYYASAAGKNFLRVALPYDSQLKTQLGNDTVFLLFFALLFVVSLAFVLYFSNRFGRSIANLHRFSSAIEQGEDVQLTFPDNELGDISRQIVANYNKLRRSEHNLTVEHNKLLENIEISKRLKHEMTGNIAHELKTPVAAIRGYIETLLGANVPPERRQQFLERCNDQILRLSSLIDDISLITKIEEAPAMFQKEEVCLYDVLCDVLYDLGERLAAAGDMVENRLSDRLIVKGSRTLIYSIFRNLVENSISYAGRGVTICVESTADSDDGSCTISYSDNGVGVPDEHLARLFERFYRVDYGRSRGVGGSGLGLSIVKNAVSLHGGQIAAQASPTGGIEFIFTLSK